MSEKIDSSKTTDVPTSSKPQVASTPENKARHMTKRTKVIIITVVSMLLASMGYMGYVYAASPAAIRNPQMDHYHFRMQILVDGKAENFGDQKYQTGYAKDQCNAALPVQPIHFHDNKDQFVHIHWKGMTGGMVLKYYGWDYIGGLNNALGYKLNDLTDVQKVTTHGDYLPQLPKGTPIYVYIADKDGYKKRSLSDFTSQDLEVFFGKKSNMPSDPEYDNLTWLNDLLFPTAAAHGTEDHSNEAHNTTTGATETEDEKLTRINNLVGDVVLFAQKTEPSDAQIKERFNKLEPLSDSTCGG
ncbi:MAG: hypothetical protein JWO55_91 [Candidatus Saccharibacteria bacterium]|jgi:hypothetical protein|nr:hypothetical protein [Candidatus Saccharibacteria bacterium]